MTKLYRAFVVRENYRNRDSVVIDWFCSTRHEHVGHEPVGLYETALEGYGDLDTKEQAQARNLIDQFLSEKEVDELKLYFRKHYGFEIKTREMEIPFSGVDKIPNFAAPAKPSDDCEYIHLDQSAGYDLSVPICGFADLSEPPNIVSYRS